VECLWPTACPVCILLLECRNITLDDVKAHVQAARDRLAPIKSEPIKSEPSSEKVMAEPDSTPVKSEQAKSEKHSKSESRLVVQDLLQEHASDFKVLAPGEDAKKQGILCLLCDRSFDLESLKCAGYHKLRRHIFANSRHLALQHERVQAAVKQAEMAEKPPIVPQKKSCPGFSLLAHPSTPLGLIRVATVRYVTYVESYIVSPYLKFGWCVFSLFNAARL
jgi:hypothetical protein